MDGRSFKIEIQLTIPVTYEITDYNWEEVQGSFYEQELQKTKQDIFWIANIIKQQGNKSLVKWLGYNDSFNSWVDNKDINNYRAKVHNVRSGSPASGWTHNFRLDYIEMPRVYNSNRNI